MRWPTVTYSAHSKVAHLAPGYANHELRTKLDALRDMTQNLQRILEQIKQQGASTETGAALVDCAKDVMTSGNTLYEASVAEASVYGGLTGADSNVRVAAWVGTLESLNREALASELSDRNSYASTVFSDSRTTAATGETTISNDVPTYKGDTEEATDYDFDDEFTIAMAKTALSEGTQAFDCEEWKEADSLFQEALALLQQLPVRHRAVSDMFDLQYKLAVCAFHLEEPAVAEVALSSLIKQQPGSDGQRRIVCDASHLLSQVYIRVGKLELATSACNNALTGRQRLLGKEHECYLESLALLSRIYQLLDKPARARILRSMIPEPRRAAVLAATDLDQTADSQLQTVQDSTYLGAQPVDSGTRDDPDSVQSLVRDSRVDSDASSLSPDGVGPHSEGGELTRTHTHTATVAKSPHGSTSRSRFVGRSSIGQVSLPNRSLTAFRRSVGPTDAGNGLSSEMAQLMSNQPSFAALKDISAASSTPQAKRGISPEDDQPVSQKISWQEWLRESVASEPQPYVAKHVDAVTRQKWLSRVGLKPLTELEHLICGNQLELAMTLVHARPTAYDPTDPARPGEPTALHFAALFGDLEIGQALVKRGFPATCRVKLTPYPWSPCEKEEEMKDALALAIAARQVPMIEMLLRSGAGNNDGGIAPDPCLRSGWLAATDCMDCNEIISTIQCLNRFGWTVKEHKRGFNLLSLAIRQLCTYRNYDKRFLRKPVVAFLLSAGAEVLPREREDESQPSEVDVPLHVATRMGAADVIPLLLQDRAEEQLRICTTEGADALGMAVAKALDHPDNSLDVIRALLEGGADASAESVIEYSHPRTFRSTIKKAKLTSPLGLARTHRLFREDLIKLLVEDFAKCKPQVSPTSPGGQRDNEASAS